MVKPIYEFDEVKLMDRARELMGEEIKRIGGMGFKKKWKTEEAFLKKAMKAEKNRVTRLIKEHERPDSKGKRKREARKKEEGTKEIVYQNHGKLRKVKPIKDKFNPVKSQSIRKAPRLSRSKSSKKRVKRIKIAC